MLCCSHTHMLRCSDMLVQLPPVSPPPIAVNGIQQWFCPHCSVEHTQYKHAGSTHAPPMLASAVTHCVPSPCQPSCELHAKLSPAEVHTPCSLMNIPSHTTQLSTGYTDNYLLIILAPLGVGQRSGPSMHPHFFGAQSFPSSARSTGGQRVRPVEVEVAAGV